MPNDIISISVKFYTMTTNNNDYPYNYKSIALRNVKGSAIYAGNPSPELIDAVNTMAEIAFKTIKKKNMSTANSAMKLNIGKLEVNCFDEDAEMSIKVGKSGYQSLSVDEAKELANFIISHIKNETESNK